MSTSLFLSHVARSPRSTCETLRLDEVEISKKGKKTLHKHEERITDIFNISPTPYDDGVFLTLRKRHQRQKDVDNVFTEPVCMHVYEDDIQFARVQFRWPNMCSSACVSYLIISFRWVWCGSPRKAKIQLNTDWTLNSNRSISHKTRVLSNNS